MGALSATVAPGSTIVAAEERLGMNIEIPDHQAAALAQLAEQEGLTLGEWFAKLAEESASRSDRKALKTGRGMFAAYGSAPSAEEIDANRREMLQHFGEGDS